MPVEPMTLERVRLSFPSAIALRDTATAEGGVARSWNQVARTGQFVSSRYGKFSIEKSDLADMLRNFNEVTPKAPTELPVDYDHLSMDPKKPGDGAAAGWMKGLELRDGGDTLWMEVEWTNDAAEAIKEKKYRFVSPSFVKDYTHKDGRKIGTTLLAAAITNHPFLESMQALTLYSFSAMGDLAVASPYETIVNLAEVGQHVTFIENEEATPELSPDERAQTFIITAIGGGLGDDEFVKLETVEGSVAYGWYPTKVLAPTRAANANPMPPKDQQQVESQQERNPMPTNTKPDDAAQKLEVLARQFMAERRIDLSAAVKLASAEDDAITNAYLEQFESGAAQRDADAAPRPVVIHNLHRKADEGFVELIGRVAREQRIDLNAARLLVWEAYPEMERAYARGEF